MTPAPETPVVRVPYLVPTMRRIAVQIMIENYQRELNIPPDQQEVETHAL